MNLGSEEMDFSTIVSEDRIKKAYEDGAFSRMPGFGKPLKSDDLSAVPQELRMAYRMMKNAGYSPEESVLRQEVLTIEDLIKKCQDDTELNQLKNQLSQKLFEYNKMISQRGVKTNSAFFKNYEHKIEQKLLSKK
ncbi:DnaJ family domain-containing protein [Mesobacillus maritimus]|uniref:DnaJ family domain-containing protein n=1 Tax=Mesobacillus maritimus TaxID=1643336 RepID=UPI00384E319E